MSDRADVDVAPVTRRSPGGGLARALVRRRWLVVAAWALICAVLIPAGSRLEERMVPAGRVPGSEFERVEQLLATRFGSPFARYAILVVDGLPVTGSPEGVASLQEIVNAVDSLPVVTGVLSALGTPDSMLLGTGGVGAIVVAGVPANAGAADALVRSLRAGTAPLASALRTRHPNVTLRWTGEDALNVDLRLASSEDVRRAEVRALPLTAVLLVVVFGGIVAAFLPIGMGVVTIPVTLGAGALLALRWPVSLLFENVVSLLGLALGIDYALLMVSRFRERRQDGDDAMAAAEGAAGSAGRTIVLSGASVAIGFAALLAVPLEELRSIGIGGLLVSAVAVLLATTLLPAMLVWLGGRIRARRAASEERHARARFRWLRWGTFVTAHPWRVLVVAALPLVALALQMPRLAPVLPSGDWLPRTAESGEAFRDLERMGRGSVLHSVRVVLVLPAGTSAMEPEGWRATERLTAHLGTDPRVGRVRSLPSLAGGRSVELVRALLPDSARRAFVSEDAALAVVDVIPGQTVPPTDAIQLVRDLRAADVPAITGLPGSSVLIGGLPAFNADYEDAIGSHVRRVVALVLGGTFIALLVGFRSVLVPVKALAMNLLTVAAAYGAVVVAFQDGALAGVFGLDGPLDAVFPTLPLLVFCAVFGISMDYEVFLIARVAEARRAGLGENGAIAEGLAQTAGVITSAAAIMIAIFGAFAFGDFLPTQLLGFALAVAVLADATLVRLAIGPALLTLAGRWNWWPGDRARVVRA